MQRGHRSYDARLIQEGNIGPVAPVARSRGDANCSIGALDSEFLVARGERDLDVLRKRTPHFLTTVSPRH